MHKTRTQAKCRGMSRYVLCFALVALLLSYNSLVATEAARASKQPLQPSPSTQLQIASDVPVLLVSHSELNTRHLNRVVDIEIEIERRPDLDDGSQFFDARVRRIRLADTEFGWKEEDFHVIRPLWHWGQAPETDWAKLTRVEIDTDKAPADEAPNKVRLAYFALEKLTTLDFTLVIKPGEPMTLVASRDFDRYYRIHAALLLTKLNMEPLLVLQHAFAWTLHQHPQFREGAAIPFQRQSSLPLPLLPLKGSLIATRENGSLKVRHDATLSQKRAELAISGQSHTLSSWKLDDPIIFSSVQRLDGIIRSTGGGSEQFTVIRHMSAVRSAD